jgi:hypothetical protein
MRNELIKLNSEQEYQDIIKFLGDISYSDFISKYSKKEEPIDKIEVFPGIYVGDIVVSLGKCHIDRKIGDIFKVLVGSQKGFLDYKRGLSNHNGHEWRLATPEEKEAFEKGITNINDIKKEPEEDFSKFIGQWVTWDHWSTKSVCKVTKIEKYSLDNYGYSIYFDEGYIKFKVKNADTWTADIKELKILSKEELKDYLPKNVYNKEFPDTVKSTSLQDYLKSLPDTFTGDLNALTGFPKEIIQKMVERQVEQGNEPDYTVFEKDYSTDKKSKGFDWMESKEGYDFWKEVILYKNFKIFYEKYPKTETKVTFTNVCNVEGILTRDGKTVVDVDHYKTPYLRYNKYETKNPCYETLLENKPNTFDHLPFVQVKELPIF